MLTRPRYELIPLGGAEEQARFLPEGATVTVTSSPRRGLEPTLRLCEHLAAAGFAPVPHLAARLVTGPGHLAQITARLERAGIREVFVVGGDPPEAAGPYDSALSLLRALADGGHRFDRVGVAGYPEKHPRIDDGVLLGSLLDKAPVSSYVVTQICFQPRTVMAWIAGVRRAGLTLPVHIGIPGPLSRAKLLEISLRIGVGDSMRYLRANAGVMTRLIARPGYRPDAFVGELASLVEEDTTSMGAGVAGLHLNTFNRVEATERWRRDLLVRHGFPPQESLG